VPDRGRLVEPVIRSYRAADAPQVVDLSLRAWAPVHDSMRGVMGSEIFERLYGDDWRAHQRKEVDDVLADPEMEIWVADVDGTVVGFVAAVLKLDEHLGEIFMLAVDPGSQNRGLGTRLTDLATDWVREAGVPVALVSTGGDAGHAPARRTYEKAGYTQFPSVSYFKAL
jgi:ribosomal protein S18 acetylase RimI-like enzyme